MLPRPHRVFRNDTAQHFGHVSSLRFPSYQINFVSQSSAFRIQHFLSISPYSRRSLIIFRKQAKLRVLCMLVWTSSFSNFCAGASNTPILFYQTNQTKRLRDSARQPCDKPFFVASSNRTFLFLFLFFLFSFFPLPLNPSMRSMIHAKLFSFRLPFFPSSSLLNSLNTKGFTASRATPRNTIGCIGSDTSKSHSRCAAHNEQNTLVCRVPKNLHRIRFFSLSSAFVTKINHLQSSYN